MPCRRGRARSAHRWSFRGREARSAWDAPTAEAASGSARARASRERRRTSEVAAAAARETRAVFPMRTRSSNGPPSSGGGERIRRLSLRSEILLKRIDAKLSVAIGHGEIDIAFDHEIVEVVARGERAQLLRR